MTPIFLAVCRIAQCFFCSKQWTLDAEEKPQVECPHCKSPDWEWGPEPTDSRFIRQGRDKHSVHRRNAEVSREVNRKTGAINPGAKSLKRKMQGRKQFQGFKKRPVDSEAESRED